MTDERKLLQDQKLWKRQEPTGAPNNEHEPTVARAASRECVGKGLQLTDTQRREGLSGVQPGQGTVSGNRVRGFVFLVWFRPQT